MRALFAAVVLVFGAGVSGTASAADCAPLQIKNSVKMEPLERYGLVVVPITLNGVEKKFLFDTGGAINAISRVSAHELNLPEYHSNYRTSDFYGEDSDSFVQVNDVRFGAAKTGGAQFQVMGNFGFREGNAPFDGILGTGIFSHDDIDLDFGARRVNFFSSDHCEGRVVYWPHQMLSVIPIKRERGHIDLPVILDGHPLTAMIDTGSTMTNLVLSRAEQKLAFSPQSAPASPQDDPAHQVYFRRFSSLSLDGVTISNPLIDIAPLQTGGSDNRPTLGSRAEHMDDESNRLAPDLIIGMDVLKHLHIYIATNEGKLYVTEAASGESVLFKNSAPVAAGVQ